MYIGAKGGGGFTEARRGGQPFGGPGAITFVQRENSDIANGKIKPNAPPAQLYDLEKDRAQTTNVYALHPEVVAELKTLLHSYQSSVPPRQRAKPAPQRKTTKANP
jgi:arylsulfatase A